MNPIEYVKRIFEEPEMPDGVADSILWGCTGWPSFFSGNNPVKQLTKQLRHAKRSLNRGYSIDQIYAGADTDKYL